MNIKLLRIYLSRLNIEAGATLIELIITAFLFSIILSMVTVALGHIMAGPRRANVRMQAHTLAMDQLEAYKAEPYPLLLPTFPAEAPECDCAGSSALLQRELIHRNHLVYERQSCVGYVQTNTEGRLVTSCQPTGLKRILVDVTYQENFSSHTVSAETLLNDPLGTPIVSSGEAHIVTRVETPQQQGVPGVSLLLMTNPTHRWVSVGQTDSRGQLEFNGLAQGSYVILPQPRRWESLLPVHLFFMVDQEDLHATLDKPFVMQKGTAIVHVHSNQPDTLVLAAPEILPDQLPEVHLGSDAPPYFSILLDENESTWALPEGAYSFKCWSPTGSVMMPPEAQNRAITMQNDMTLNCNFS